MIQRWSICSFGPLLGNSTEVHGRRQMRFGTVVVWKSDVRGSCIFVWPSCGPSRRFSGVAATRVDEDLYLSEAAASSPHTHSTSDASSSSAHRVDAECMARRWPKRLRTCTTESIGTALRHPRIIIFFFVFHLHSRDEAACRRWLDWKL